MTTDYIATTYHYADTGYPAPDLSPARCPSCGVEIADTLGGCWEPAPLCSDCGADDDNL